MAKVGPKGQVVIDKRIRDELGIKPGCQAVQRVVDGRVELRFLPPRHNRSLAGIFRAYATRPTDTDEQWREAREEGNLFAAQEKMAHLRETESPD